MDAVVILAVILSRFIAPLAIPRYPLPGIVVALLLDAVDQTIFEQLAVEDLGNYQSYDKALDIYYLAIAYISTFRNWTNMFAFMVGRFLWYFRLVGVVLFELLDSRAVLLIFPNVFEYFFIVYAATRLRWNPNRFTRRHLIIIASVLWVGVKLPQEYWIHVAKLDTTDLIMERVLGMPLGTSWFEAIAENLWVVPVLLVAVAAVAVLLRWIRSKLPPYDWQMSLSTAFDLPKHPARDLSRRQPRHWLIEKIVLVGLVSVVFSQTVPGMQVSVLQLIAATAAVVVVNSFVSHWLALRGTHWRSTLTEFAVMSGINLAIAILYIVLVPFTNGEIGAIGLLFVILLLTLIVTLYDHYRPIRDMHAEIAEKKDTIHEPYEEDGQPA